MTLCEVETFPALEAIPSIRAAFLRRAPDIDVLTDRDTALARLWDVHRFTADAAGFAEMPFAVAQQVHGAGIARVDQVPAQPIPDVDGLITNQKGISLAIYVADCAAVYLVDRRRPAIALVHSGKKGTEHGIVSAAVTALRENYGSAPGDLIVQIAPCIRPPHYEVDFAAEIIRQAQRSGVGEVHDCGRCTASHPDLYYSYRREMGRTGRLLALLALV